MKTKLKKLAKRDLEQMYFYFFNCCTTCRDFIQFVPKYFLIEEIVKDVREDEIRDYLQENQIEL